MGFLNPLLGTEVDPSSLITLTTTSVAGVNIRRDYNGGLHFDPTGVDFFVTDIEIRCKMRFVVTDSSSYTYAICVSSTIRDWIDQTTGGYAAGKYAQTCTPFAISTTQVDLYYQEQVSSNGYNSLTPVRLNENTDYWVKFTRNDSLGTFGTGVIYIYSNNTYTTLVGSTTMTLHEKRDFRYLFCFTAGASRTVPAEAQAQSITTSDIECLTPAYDNAAGQPIMRRFGGIPYVAVNKGVW